jgi:hypothetical protein
MEFITGYRINISSSLLRQSHAHAHGLPPPCQSLSEGVDLIIVTTRKRKQLRHEIFKPCRLARKKDRTGDDRRKK